MNNIPRFTLGVVTVPDRRELVDELLLTLNDYTVEEHVYVDHNYNGCTWNMVRAINDTLDSVEIGDWVMITSDDIQPSKNFGDDLLRVLNATDTYIISLRITTQRHTRDITPEDRGEGYHYGKSLYQFSDHGFLIRKTPTTKDIGRDYTKWRQSVRSKRVRGASYIRRHFDRDFGAFLWSEGYKWVVACPALTKHKTHLPSIIGHDNGNLGLDNFIDDLEPKDNSDA